MLELILLRTMVEVVVVRACCVCSKRPDGRFGVGRRHGLGVDNDILFSINSDSTQIWRRTRARESYIIFTPCLIPQSLCFTGLFSRIIFYACTTATPRYKHNCLRIRILSTLWLRPYEIVSKTWFVLWHPLF